MASYSPSETGDTVPELTEVDTHQPRLLNIPEAIRLANRTYHDATTRFTRMLLEVPDHTAETPAKAAHSQQIYPHLRNSAVIRLDAARSALSQVDEKTPLDSLLQFESAYYQAVRLRQRCHDSFPVHSNAISTLQDAINNFTTASQYFTATFNLDDSTKTKHADLLRMFCAILDVLLSVRVPSYFTQAEGVTSACAALGCLSAIQSDRGREQSSEQEARPSVRITSLPTSLAATSTVDDSEVDASAGDCTVRAVRSATTQPSMKEPCTLPREQQLRPAASKSLRACVTSTSESISKTSRPSLSVHQTCSILDSPRAYLKECFPHFLLAQFSVPAQVRRRAQEARTLLQQILTGVLKAKFGVTPEVEECLQTLPNLLAASDELGVAAMPAKDQTPIVTDECDVLSAAKSGLVTAVPDLPSAAETPLPEGEGDDIISRLSPTDKALSEEFMSDIPVHILPLPVPSPYPESIDWDERDTKEVVKRYKRATNEVALQLRKFGDPDYEANREAGIVKRGTWMKSHVFAELAVVVRRKYGDAVRMSPQFQLLRTGLMDAIEGRDEAMSRYYDDEPDYDGGKHLRFYYVLLIVRDTLLHWGDWKKRIAHWQKFT